MSWIIVAYYLIILSRRTSLDDNELDYRLTSPFVPTARTTQTISKLLIKEFSKLNTGHIAKLRGVTTSNGKRHKPANNLRAFIFIYTSLQTLRSVITLVTDKLLRAGDVELNPGPSPPSSSRSMIVQSSSLPSGSAAPPGFAQSNDTESPSTVPLQANPTSTGEVTLSDTIRRVPDQSVVPESSTLAVSNTPGQALQIFPKQKDIDTSTSTGVVAPPGVQDSNKPASVHFGVAVSQSEPDRNFLVDTKVVQKASPTQQSYPEFDVLTHNNHPLHDLISASESLRAGDNCRMCPMCYKEKQRFIKSHIFPRGLLTVFKRIHCSLKKGDHEDFIYDFSRGVRMGPKALSYQMLCEDCEKLTKFKRWCETTKTEVNVCEETLLRELYIFLMDKPSKECIKVPNDHSWLQHVLANIMYRGLLVSENLSGSFKDKNFLQAFFALQEYCRTREVMKHPFYLFLLPNQPFNEELIAFMYPFEYILRNPMFSSVFRDTEIGNFVYTKFDCFHLVLPLDARSMDYFNSFHNVLETYEVLGQAYINLRWTKQCMSVREFDRETDAVKYSISEEVKPHLFPNTLLKISIWQYREFVSMIYCLPKDSQLTSHCKSMMEYLPGLNHEYPTKDFKGSVMENEPQQSQQPGASVTFTKMSEKELSEMIVNASKISPLGIHQKKVEELTEEIRLKKLKVQELSEEVESQQEIIDELAEDIENKNDELEQMRGVVNKFNTQVKRIEEDLMKERKIRLSLEKDLTQREFDMLSYEEKISLYTQRLQVVHSLLYTQRRKLNQSRLENVELKQVNKTIEKNLYEALELMICDLENLQKLQGQPESVESVDLVGKLFSRCQKMKSMIHADLT